MKHLSNGIDCYSKAVCDVSNYHIKSTEILTEKLKRRFPVTFIINKSNEFLFLIKKSRSPAFFILKHVQTHLGLNNFEIGHAKNTHSPLCLTKQGAVTKYSLVSTKIGQLDNHCFTAIINNWLSLDKHGAFRVMNEFNYDN